MAGITDLSQIEDLAMAGAVWTEPNGPVWSDVRLVLSNEGAVSLERVVYAGVRLVSADEHYGRAWSWPIAGSVGDGYGYRIDIGGLAVAMLSDTRLRGALAAIAGPVIHYSDMSAVVERLEALAEAHVRITE